MGHYNRKATRDEMAHARCVIKEAFPQWTPVISGRGGRMAPRYRTISFRLRDEMGRFHSNVTWLLPEWLATLSVEDVRHLVKLTNGVKG
jgi:hypothetical protein